MAEQEKNCYLGINGKKYGPLSEQDIKKLYAAKKINGDTKFARIGDKEWVTVSETGIVTPIALDDGLPPLPPEDKPAEANTNGLPKKSKLGCIAVGLGVTLVAVVVIGVLLIISNMGNNPAVPANNDIVAVEPSGGAAQPAEAVPKTEIAAQTPEAVQEAVPESKNTAQTIPERYIYGFLEFQVTNEASYQDVGFVFHNNSEEKIKMIRMKGKLLDADGVVVADFSPSATDILAGDKVKVTGIVLKSDKAKALRVETVFVSSYYVGSGDYRGIEIPLDDIIPILHLDKLNDLKPSYYYTGLQSQSSPSEDNALHNPVNEENNTTSATNNQRTNLSATDAENEVLHIRGIWDDAMNGIPNDSTRIVEKTKGANGIQYARTYCFYNGQLIFAYWEGSDAQRFYFKDGMMFRWINTPQAGEAVIYDNRFDLAEYLNWEQTVLKDIER